LAGTDSNNTRGRFFLADPSLATFGGHSFGYFSSLRQVLRAQGRETVILGNRQVAQPLREEHGVVPLFSVWCDQRSATSPKTRSMHERDMVESLRHVSRTYDLQAGDVVLINTLRQWPLRGIVDWLEELPPQRRPAVVVVLHFTSHLHHDRWVEEAQAADYYRTAFKRIEKSRVRERIVFFADAEELVTEYTELNPNLTFHLAPIPHIRESSRPPAPDAGRPWRIGFAGEVRVGKGFDLIPYLAERIEADGLGNEVELHLQTYCGDEGSKFYAPAFCRLKQPFIVTYPDALDEEEYYRFVESLDLMLIPYPQENYHSQTSGVFAEALGYGQVVVAPRGTWMGRQLKKFGGGRIFVPGDEIDFADQVLHVLRNRSAYRAEAAGRIQEWLRFHNPRHFLQRVDEAVGRLAA
jgi:hypothetical protein